MKMVMAVVLVPILALLGWVGLLERERLLGAPVRLRVQGYDPRDLLAGHYLRYSLNLEPAPPCKSVHSGEACVCLKPEEGTAFHKSYWGGACSQKPADCNLLLKGHCRYGRFDSGLERYYIPESLASALRTVPPEASIIVSLSARGKGVVTKLLVGDEDVEAWARQKRQ